MDRTDKSATWTIAGRIAGRAVIRSADGGDICDGHINGTVDHWEGDRAEADYILCIRPGGPDGQAGE